MAITEKYVSSAGGGAHDGSTEADAFSWAEMVTDINLGGKAGNRYNVKGSVSRTTTTDTVTGDGSLTSPIIIRGYSSTIGDAYLGRTSSNGDLITTNMPAISYTTGSWSAGGATHIIYESLNISGANSGATWAVGAAVVLFRCVASNSSTGATAIAINFGGENASVIDCDASLTGASGGRAAISITSNCIAAGNRVKGGPAAGFYCNANGVVALIDNLIYDCGTIGVNSVSTLNRNLFYGNTIVGCGGDGIDIVTGTTFLSVAMNNMITDGSAWGIDGVSAANAIFVAYNRTRDNTSGAINSATDWITASTFSHVTTDTGGSETDYTAAGSDDYTLISASPAKGVGHFIPRSIGCLQASAGGGILTHPGMAGGMRG